MKISTALLQDYQDAEGLDDWSEGPNSIQGTYSTLKFVLKLTPEIHKALSSLDDGIYGISSLRWETIQAFSTALHENIHWWQHIGSTSGFIYSLAAPIQFHANLKYLRDFLNTIGPKMPIFNITSSKRNLQSLSQEEQQLCNTIINNYMDVEFFFLYQYDPERFRQKIKGNPYFECLGHSFDITYGYAINTLITTLGFHGGADEVKACFPDPDVMERINTKRRVAKIENYHYESQTIIPPFGMRHIFEGQARFIQIQYLSSASNGKFNFIAAKESGMMSELYTKAFDFYINETEQAPPTSPMDNAVNLFLLVCDISLNPTAGFPLTYKEEDETVKDNCPGIRFLMICNFLRDNLREALYMMSHINKESYSKLSNFICDNLGISSPLMSLQQIEKWSELDSVKSLMIEHKELNYRPGNMAIRYLLSHFIEFSLSKLHRPDFFCWPAHFMAGARTNDESRSLFAQHRAKFVNNSDDDGIYILDIPGINKDRLANTLNNFYADIVAHTITNQWIGGRDVFKYDLGWLSSKHEYMDMRNYVNEIFQDIYGVNTENFEYVRCAE